MGAMDAHGIQPSRFLADGQAFMDTMLPTEPMATMAARTHAGAPLGSRSMATAEGRSCSRAKASSWTTSRKRA